MKRSPILLLFLIGFLLMGCAGLPEIFAPVEPYCSLEEQKDSLIYEYLNPGDADFLLMAGLALQLDKHPEQAPGVKKALLSLKAVVETGIAYNTFAIQAKKDFGPLTAVVLSKAMERFKGVQIPLSICDKRLALGAVDHLLEIVEFVQLE